MAHPTMGYLNEMRATRIRSLNRVEVPLGPLTILVGENGAGKSNIMRALQLCTEICAEIAVDFKRSEGKWKTMRLMLDLAFEPEEKFAASVRNDALLTVGIVQRGRGTSAISLHYDISKPEVIRYKIVSLSELAAITFAKDIVWTPVERFLWAPAAVLDDLITSDSLLEWRPWEPIDPAVLVKALAVISQHSRATDCIVGIGRDLFGMDFAPVLEEAPNKSGTREEVEALLAMDLAIGPDGAPVPLYLMSLGTRQFFPILVQASLLIAKEQGGVLALEEPEMSLHPKAQVGVGEFLASLTEEGIQVVLTTHSDYLLNGVLKQVRANVVKPDDLCLIECYKGRQGTSVRRLNVEPSGRVEGWIPSFVEVSDYLFRDWVNSLPKEAV